MAYIDFVTPALLAVSTVMSGTNSGIAIATDATTGLFDRFRTLPVDLRLVYLARTLADGLLTVLRVVVLLLAAWLLLGFDPDGSLVDLVGVVAVLLPLSMAMSMVFLLVGLRLGHPEAVQFAGMMLMMPFMFVSSAFAPLDTMPTWLQTAATVNPVTHAIDAVRSLTLGAVDGGAVLAAVGARWRSASSLRRPPLEWRRRAASAVPDQHLGKGRPRHAARRLSAVTGDLELDEERLGLLQEGRRPAVRELVAGGGCPADCLRVVVGAALGEQQPGHPVVDVGLVHSVRRLRARHGQRPGATPPPRRARRPRARAPRRGVRRS